MKRKIRESNLYRLLVRLFSWTRPDNEYIFKGKSLNQSKQAEIRRLVSDVYENLANASLYGNASSMLSAMKTNANKCHLILGFLS